MDGQAGVELDQESCAFSDREGKLAAGVPKDGQLLISYFLVQNYCTLK